jgi:uncharacterized FlgJ-related protein
MDSVVVALITGMVLLIMIAVATLHAQQTRQLRQIEERLEAMGAENKRKEEGLRFQRTEVMDPISQLESQLITQERNFLTEQEITLILKARERMKQISEELKQLDAWRGAPYDLEWAEYLERVPVLKALYLRAMQDQGLMEQTENVAPTDPAQPAPTPVT